MMNIALNINNLRKEIPSSVKIVAVSKTKPADDILAAYNAGQRAFGENRVREMIAKKELLPEDIEWHMVGHLQTNKVKSIVPFVSMIQSIDTPRLLSAVNSEAARVDRIIDCLLQYHIAREETKFGFNHEEAIQLLESDEFRKLKNIRLCGLMGMATFTDDNEVIHKEFRLLGESFRDLKNKFFINDKSFCHLSMGMSGDYHIAIEEGSTMVRIGSLIFGER
jgi:pyridoxal phosphate enzyme (YggS family)